MEVEIKISKKTGEIFIPRDHEDMVKLSKAINPKDSSFEEFFDSKPENIFGDKNYNSFCG